MRAAGSAGVCSAGLPCVGIRPGRPNSAGFHSNSSAQRERAALKHLGHMPRVPASRRSPSCTNPRPPHREVHLGGWRKTFAIFKRGFGIDGPSRPRRCPRPAVTRADGLDANSGPRAGAPSRDRQGTTPLASRRLDARAATDSSTGEGQAPQREALRIVHHEKERRQTGPRFASGPAPRQCAGRGHRRGLDDPTMPKHFIRPDKLPLRMLNAGTPCAGHGGSSDSSQRS